MTTIAQSVAGSTLKVSASLPATYDSAGFAALTYTTVAEVTDLGSGLGKKYDMIEHRPVNDRKKYKFKGGYDNGSLAIKLASATATATDAGQTLMIAASNSDADYSFKITVQDGSDYYFTAKCMNFTTDFGTLNNILAANAELQVTSDIVQTV